MKTIVFCIITADFVGRRTWIHELQATTYTADNRENLVSGAVQDVALMRDFYSIVSATEVASYVFHEFRSRIIFWSARPH